jgi:hypothetical protein
MYLCGMGRDTGGVGVRGWAVSLCSRSITRPANSESCSGWPNELKQLSRTARLPGRAGTCPRISMLFRAHVGLNNRASCRANGPHAF